MSVKMIKCSACGNDIANNAKTCPHCGAKNKKPFYKKWSLWVLIAIVLIIIIAVSSGSNDNQSASTTQEVQTTSDSSESSSQTIDNVTADSETQTKEDAKVPTEYKSALNKAKVYSDTMHMSKKGIYDQLTSEYGEKFSAEAAQYAMDNLEADWNKNALEKAKDYQEMDMSPNAIYDQLISEYGEQFTEEEANYAISHLE